MSSPSLGLDIGRFIFRFLDQESKSPKSPNVFKESKGSDEFKEVPTWAPTPAVGTLLYCGPQESPVLSVDAACNYSCRSYGSLARLSLLGVFDVSTFDLSSAQIYVA